MTEAPRFVATYRLDGGSWQVTVSKPRLSARARTLESARIAIVSAIAEHFDVSPSIVVVDDKVVLGGVLDRLVAEATAAREAALAASERNRLASEAAAVRARDAGVSLRDTAHLLGLSHSRIQQILDAADTAAGSDSKEHR